MSGKSRVKNTAHISVNTLVYSVIFLIFGFGLLLPANAAKSGNLGQSLGDDAEGVEAQAVELPDTEQEEAVQESELVQYFALDVPLTLDNVYLGDISAEVAMDGSAKLPLQRLIDLTIDRAEAEFIEKLNNLQTEHGEFATIEQLQAIDFNIDYDSASLSVIGRLPRSGAIPIQLRRPDSSRTSPNGALPVSAFSAASTIIFRPTHQHVSASGNTGFQPLEAELRGFFALGGFDGAAITYRFDYDGGADDAFRRRDLTLTIDDFDRALRFQAGDIRPTTFGFQSGVDLLGISLEKNYRAVQPFRNLRPSGRGSFTLETPARVYFEVNGIVVSTQDLDSGFYSISDFPFITGANDVRVVVEDELGRRELTRFSSYVDNLLLRSGLTTFGLSAGVQREQQSSGFQPNYGDDWRVMGFVEHGLTESVTLSSQFEASSDGGLIGASGVVGTKIGLIAAEGSFTFDDNLESGYAAALRYTWRPQNAIMNIQPEFDAQFSYINDHFASLGDFRAPRRGEYNFTGRALFRFNRNALSFAGSWRDVDGTTSNTGSVFLTRPLGRVSASLGVQTRASSSSGERETRVLLNLSRSFGRAGIIQARGASNPLDLELEYRKVTTRDVGQLGARFSVGHMDGLEELQAELNYIHTRGEFSIRNDTQTSQFSDNISSSQTRGRAAFGFGFADGTFGAGRPILDNFVIFKRHASLSDSKINIRRSDDGPLSGILGNGVPIIVPLAGAYRPQRHIIDAESLPDGYDIGDSAVKTFPPHHSGAVKTVGSNASNAALGVLRTADGEPLVLEVGQFVPFEIEGQSAVDFFTNRTGRFVAERLAPGYYDIILNSNDRLVGRILIEEGDSGIIDLGTLTVPKED